jgi:hypothetical protein
MTHIPSRLHRGSLCGPDAEPTPGVPSFPAPTLDARPTPDVDPGPMPPPTPAPRPTIGDAIVDLESFVSAHAHAVDVAADAGTTHEQALAALAASTVALARFLAALAATLKVTTGGA